MTNHVVQADKSELLDGELPIVVVPYSLHFIPVSRDLGQEKLGETSDVTLVAQEIDPTTTGVHAHHDHVVKSAIRRRAVIRVGEVGSDRLK